MASARVHSSSVEKVTMCRQAFTKEPQNGVIGTVNAIFLLDDKVGRMQFRRPYFKLKHRRAHGQRRQASELARWRRKSPNEQVLKSRLREML